MSRADSHLDLLSAYLDNEATPDEVARVETLLKDRHPREVLEEIKALREGLRALPQRKLGTEFTARVMDEIRRREGAQDVRLRIDAGLGQTHGTRRGLSKTAIRGMWATAALATVLLLAVAASLLVPPQQSKELVQDELRAKTDNEIVSPLNVPGDSADSQLPKEFAPRPELVKQPADSARVGREEESQLGPETQGLRSVPQTLAGSDMPQAVPNVGPTAESALEGVVNVAPGAIQALLFVELAISENGTKQKAFQELLGRHKVEMSEDWKIPGGVERVLLKLPCVDGAEAFVVENQREASSGHPVDLVYSVMLGAEVNRLQEDIQSLPTGIVGYDFSIGIRPKELADNRFVRNRRAMMKAGQVEQFLGEAKQIVLSGLLFSPLSTGRNVFAKLEASAPKQPREKIPVETGADEAFELLFVIHRVP